MNMTNAVFETEKGKFAFIRLENMKQTVTVTEPHIDYGLVKLMSEELCQEVVPVCGYLQTTKDFTEVVSEKTYPDYAGDYEYLQYARYSLKSLMISFGLVEGDWILIKYKG